MGRIETEIDAQGLRASTLVVLTSDHGEELYQHNRFFLHAWSIYDSVLRVPLVLRLPGVLPAGRLIDGVIRIEDVGGRLLVQADGSGTGNMPYARLGVYRACGEQLSASLGF